VVVVVVIPITYVTSVGLGYAWRWDSEAAVLRTVTTQKGEGIS